MASLLTNSKIMILHLNRSSCGNLFRSQVHKVLIIRKMIDGLVLIVGPANELLS